jgi:hypothetical protein
VNGDVDPGDGAMQPLVVSTTGSLRCCRRSFGAGRRAAAAHVLMQAPVHSPTHYTRRRPQTVLVTHAISRFATAGSAALLGCAYPQSDLRSTRHPQRAHQCSPSPYQLICQESPQNAIGQEDCCQPTRATDRMQLLGSDIGIRFGQWCDKRQCATDQCRRASLLSVIIRTSRR